MFREEHPQDALGMGRDTQDSTRRNSSHPGRALLIAQGCFPETARPANSSTYVLSRALKNLVKSLSESRCEVLSVPLRDVTVQSIASSKQSMAGDRASAVGQGAFPGLSDFCPENRIDIL